MPLSAIQERTVFLSLTGNIPEEPALQLLIPGLIIFTIAAVMPVNSRGGGKADSKARPATDREA